MDTGKRNSKGRVVWMGPRGGYYVKGPGGRKIRMDKKAVPKTPTEAMPVRTGAREASAAFDTGKRNSKGRVVWRGPRGGYYVEGADGHKIRMDKKAVPKTPGPSGSAPARPAALATNTGTRDSKGRVVWRGPRGGLFVLAAGGRKLPVKTHVPPLRTDLTTVKTRVPPLRTDLTPRRAGAARVAAVWKDKVRRRIDPIPRVGTKYKMGVKVPRVFIDPATLQRVVKSHIEYLPDGNAIGGETKNRVRTGDVLVTRRRNVDADWFNAQSEYLKSLSDDDLMSAAAYTTRSHQWIGPYMREGVVYPLYYLVLDGHITPLYPQLRDIVRRRKTALKDRSHFAGIEVLLGPDKLASYRQHQKFVREDAYTYDALAEAYAAYVKDLKRIIAAAPPIVRPIVVYRGYKQDIFEGHLRRWYVNDKFISTAFDLGRAVGYGRDGQLWRITLLPGTQALLAAALNQWGASGETEVIVNKDTVYSIKRRNVKQHAIVTGGTKTVVVTDMDIAGHVP